MVSKLQWAIARLFFKVSKVADTFFRVLYNKAHDLDEAKEFRSRSTRQAFAFQWQQYPEGEYLLSDPWFRDNVDRILSQQEILLSREWFRGKKVLDAGCGNGRWTYGFLKLGAAVTCVDQADSAIAETRKSTGKFEVQPQFIQSPLELLDQRLPRESFDLVFSWGVLHHCTSYTRALDNVTSMVKPGGIIYLYLYGRESVPFDEDLQLFKKRFVYNVLMSEKQREAFLLRAAGGDPKQMHNQHDIFAPMVNRRFTFEEVKSQLERRGFTDVLRTIEHSEIFVRAVKGKGDYSNYTLAKSKPPFWFQQHSI